jgi:hypothetical protein
VILDSKLLQGFDFTCGDSIGFQVVFLRFLGDPEGLPKRLYFGFACSFFRWEIQPFQLPFKLGLLLGKRLVGRNKIVQVFVGKLRPIWSLRTCAVQAYSSAPARAGSRSLSPAANRSSILLTLWAFAKCAINQRLKICKNFKSSVLPCLLRRVPSDRPQEADLLRGQFGPRFQGINNPRCRGCKANRQPSGILHHLPPIQ